MKNEMNPWNDIRSSSVNDRSSASAPQDTPGAARTRAESDGTPPQEDQPSAAVGDPAPEVDAAVAAAAEVADPAGAESSAEPAAAAETARRAPSVAAPSPLPSTSPEAPGPVDLPPVVDLTPADKQASSNHNLSVTAVILGVLSILTCGVPIVGLALAIAAIVCAVRSTPKGTSTGMATAGKVLGIAGAIIAALVNLLLIAAIMLALASYDDAFNNPVTDSINEHLEQRDQEELESIEQLQPELHDQVKVKFDGLDPTDPELKTMAKQYLASMVLDDFSDDIGSFGVDPEAYANWMLVDLSFRTSDMLFSDPVGVCYIYVTHRDPAAFVIAWAKALDQAADDPEYRYLPQEQASALMQEIFYNCLAECTATTETRVRLEFLPDGDAWKLDESSWDEAYPEIFFPES